MPDESYEVFISYSSEDSELVEALVKLIQLDGKRVFRDRDEIKPGDRWEDKILSALESSRQFVIFWCCHAECSDWVEREIYLAIKHDRRIVPVLLCHHKIPESLKPYQYLDIRVVTEHECLNKPRSPADWRSPDGGNRERNRSWQYHAKGKGSDKTARRIRLASLAPLVIILGSFIMFRIEFPSWFLPSIAAALILLCFVMACRWIIANMASRTAIIVVMKRMLRAWDARRAERTGKEDEHDKKTITPDGSNPAAERIAEAIREGYDDPDGRYVYT